MGRTLQSQFLDACLRAAPSLDAWASEVCGAARPIFERGGAHGAFLCLTRSSREHLTAASLRRVPGPMTFVGRGAGEAWSGVVNTRFQFAGSEQQRAFQPFRIAFLSRLLGYSSLHEVSFWKDLPAREFHDLLGLEGGADTFGVLGTFISRRGWSTARNRELREMRRVLVRTLPGRATTATPDDADAVIAPDGRILAAPGGLGRGGAAMLATAVRRLEDARLGADLDAEGERLWDDLVAGRWSVCEHVERDGKRLLLLVRSRQAALDADEAALLARLGRGDAVKQIAIDLDVAVSTASARVSAALAKLGFRSRADYLRFAPRRPAAR